MPDKDGSQTDQWLKFAQLASIVVGVVITVLSFNDTRNKEAEAKKAAAEAQKLEIEKYDFQKYSEAHKAQIEAAQPFLVKMERPTT